MNSLDQRKGGKVMIQDNKSTIFIKYNSLNNEDIHYTYLSQSPAKGKRWHMHPTKTQVSLCVRTKQRIRSDCASAQSDLILSFVRTAQSDLFLSFVRTDLNLHLTNMPTYTLCWMPAHFKTLLTSGIILKWFTHVRKPLRQLTRPI